jgi:hypothetical protein
MLRAIERSRLLVDGQLAPSEHDDRHVGQDRVAADLLQHLEPGEVREPQV